MSYERPGVKTKKLNAPSSNTGDASTVIGLIAVAGDGLTDSSKTQARTTSAVDFINAAMSSASPKYRGYKYTDDIDYSTASGSLTWKGTFISVPYIKELVAKVSVSALPSGTYKYKITAIKRNDYTTTPYGETSGSNETEITTTTALAIQLNWIAVEQAEGYRIYRENAGGSAYELLYEMIGEGVTWTDEGVYALDTTVTIPTSNDAYRKPPASEADVAGYWTGDTGVGTPTTAANNLSVDLDGQGARVVTGINLTGVASPAERVVRANYYLEKQLGTAGYTTSGKIPLNLANLKAVTDASFIIKGQNECFNGDFGITYVLGTAGVNWTVGADWVISAGLVTATICSADLVHTPVIPLVNGKTYEITFTVASSPTNNFLVKLDGSTVGAAITTSGEHTRTVAYAGGAGWTFTGVAFTGAVSNVIIRRVDEIANTDLSGASTLADIAALLQSAVQTATSSLETVIYNSTTGKMTVASDMYGSNSMVELFTPATGTDVTLIGLLDFAHGFSKDGVDADVVMSFGSSVYALTSGTEGATSSIAMVASVVASSEDLYPSTSGLDFAGGSATAGTSGTTTYYDLDYVLVAVNAFSPETYTQLSNVEADFGSTSSMYEQAENMIADPPIGSGASVLICCGVPAMERAAVQAALVEMGKEEMDISVIATDDVDILRDHKEHCVFYGQMDEKKERVGIGMLNKSMSVDDAKALAVEFDSDQYMLVWDNQSTETNLATLVAGNAGALASKSDSIINNTLNVEALEDKKVWGTGTCNFAAESNVCVCDKNEAGVFTVIDDLMTGGDDLVGTLTDNALRKVLRRSFASLAGNVKITTAILTTLKSKTMVTLTAQKGDLIDNYEDSSIVVEKSTSDRWKAIIFFTYERLYTLKRIEFQYYVK